MNIKVAVIILLLVNWFNSSLAQTPEVSSDSIKYEQRLQHGLQDFYESDWDKASSTFLKLQQEYPKDARAYFFDSMIPFWQYFFAGKEPAAASSFLKKSEKVLSVSLGSMTSNTYDTTTVLMLSGLYGYRGLVAASEKKYQKAIQSGVRGFKYTRQLLRLDSTAPKALIGKGIFYYMIGSVPAGLKWMTNIAGMSGSVEEGFKVLERAAQSKSYVSTDAKMMLAYLYERENHELKSLEHLQDLSEKYPENIIFQYHLARLYEKTGQPYKARSKYKLVASMQTQSLYLLKEKSKNRLKVL